MIAKARAKQLGVSTDSACPRKFAGGTFQEDADASLSWNCRNRCKGTE
jgi:hypothetical protein